MTALIPPKVPWNKLRSSRKTGIEEDPIGYDYYRDDDNDDVRVVPLVCKAGRMGISRKRNEEKADTDERNSIQTALDEVAAKWSSQEDVTYLKRNEKLLEGPQIWTPKNAPPSPTLDLRSVNFDSDSLKTNKTSKSSDNNQSAKFIKAQESFAWKDPTLDKKLEELRKRAESTSSNKSFSEDRAFDKAIDSSIGSWSKLPKAPNQDVVLLKKAREEKKVKKYLEDNFTKEDRIIGENDVIYEIKREYENQDEDHRLHKMADLQPLQFKGLGPKTSDGGFSNGYASEPEYSKSKSSFGKSGYSSLDRKRANDDIDCRRSPPRSPPPFSKTESRFERERRLKVGAVSDYVTGKSDCEDEDSGRLSSPPSVSSAQAKYEKDRFRVQPGRIEDYSLGRGSIASQERQRQTPPPSINKFHMQKAIKDGYESDSNIIFRRREDKVPRPQTPVEARSAYTQIQKGGDIPVSGLRMTAPEKSKESQGGRYTEGEVNIHYRSPVRREEKDYICEEELRKRQEQQMRKFYEGIEHKKEMQMLQDVQNRKHHDTLLPSQKSPIPLDRYEDFDGRQERIINRTRGSSHSPRRAQKLTAKALYNFQAQNPRELSFKKGDIIYIRRQIDANWYEGERNAMIGIFPLTYVELVSDSVPSTLNNRGKSVPEGQGKAKYSFQSQTPIELSLIKGEMVTLTRRIDDNWFEGRIGSRKGIFPTSYVEVICEPGESRRSISPYLKPVAAPAAHSTLKNGNILQPSYTPNFYSVQSPYSTLSRPGSSNSCHQMTTTSYTSKNIVTMDSKNDAVPFRALYNYRPQNDDEVELAEGDIVYVMEKCDDGWFVGTSQRTGVFGTFPGNYVTKV